MSSFATERYEVEDSSPPPSTDFEVLEEGSVVGACGPDSTELLTSHTLADVPRTGEQTGIQICVLAAISCLT